VALDHVLDVDGHRPTRVHRAQGFFSRRAWQGVADAALSPETLEEVRSSLEADLREVFGHSDAVATVIEGERATVQVHARRGRFVLAWPPKGRLAQAEGQLGAHARIALELLMAAETPAELFESYRPASDVRRRIVFDALRGYVDETLGGNPFYDDLVVVERGPAMLVFGDDEYALVTDDGNHRGHGILHWKVKRLLAYALTDADEALERAP